MAFLSLLGEIFTSILIGYLSFTNALAGYIEELLPPPQEVLHFEADKSQKKATSGTTEQKIIPTAHSGSGTIPKILLEDRAFQRAALLASRDPDIEILVDESIPLHKRVEDALVNIFCQYKTKDFIRTTTGTGFFINQKGVVLTNAHVAQFLLLRDVDDTIIDARCVVRSGNPATPKYEAELLYLPPAWIMENAKLINEETPRGTGERDYALLYISKSVDSAPLPARFPALPINTNLLPRSTTGQQVLTAGYPAEALFREGARAKLVPRIASTTVGELYTFGSNFADIFEVSASIVGEQGASGGPIVHLHGEVFGLIVTKGDDEASEGKRLRALTLSYVDRTITDETGYSLNANMRGDIAFRGGIYNQALVPFLSQVLARQLTENN